MVELDSKEQTLVGRTLSHGQKLQFIKIAFTQILYAGAQYVLCVGVTDTSRNRKTDFAASAGSKETSDTRIWITSRTRFDPS